ncbi:MAG TPA: lmo0937 family membrane protein [Thermoanaerobaculia bacterium]|nr:lmo0937 family membrane protein [Thermoanaerobaculia bacterium]
MLMTIGIILLILWALGLFAFHVTSGVFHVLIVLAVIAIVMHLVRGNRLTA